MKSIFTLLFTGLLCAGFATANPMDTVVIELDNDSKIIIYTKNKADLRDIENYDINKMIRNLNKELKGSNVEYIELEDKDGNVYKNDTTVAYIDEDDVVRIRIRGLEILVDENAVDDWDDFEDRWDDDSEFKKYTYIEKPRKRTQNFFNFEFGMSNWLEDGKYPNRNDEPYSVRSWGSWYWGLNFINRTQVAGPLFLDWGFGFTWFDHKMQNNGTIISKGDDNIEFTPADPALDPIKSKLTASYVNFNLVPMFDFAKGQRRVKSYERGGVKIKNYRKEGIRFGVGGYVGYRVGSSTKFVYRENGKKQKDKGSGNLYVENLRYGVRAQFGWKGVDFFANYDLNPVFSSGRGPIDENGDNANLQNLSFGFIF